MLGPFLKPAFDTNILFLPLSTLADWPAEWLPLQFDSWHDLLQLLFRLFD